MTYIAGSILIRQGENPVIDGYELPWHIAPDVDIRCESEVLHSVTLSIYADRVDLWTKEAARSEGYAIARAAVDRNLGGIKAALTTQALRGVC